MKRPTEAEILAAALTVLRLGGAEDLAAQMIAKKRAPPEEKGAEHKFSPRWKTTPHTCPKCGHGGMVDPDFGMRLVRGVERRQSWCAKCRAGTNYHNQPRLADRKATAGSRRP